MYELQTRPDGNGRERVGPKQWKQLLIYCGASHQFHSLAQSSLLDSRVLRTVVLTLVTTGLMACLSACGTVNYHGLNTSTSLSDISCGTQSLTGPQSKACSVNLSSAPSSPFVVTLKSSNSALQVPSSVTVASGASSASFNAVTSAVLKEVSVTVTGSAGGVIKTAVLTLYPGGSSSAPTSSLSKVACASQTLTGPTTTSCSVYMSSATGNSMAVSLSTNNSALQVPATVTVPAGSASAVFTATASAVANTQNVTLSAVANGITQTNVIQLNGSSTSGQPTTQYNVQLSWNAPTSTSVQIVGYNVYRADSSSTGFSLLNLSPSSSTSYIDSTVSSGVTYDYVVKSVDPSGVESAPSPGTTVVVP